MLANLDPDLMAAVPPTERPLARRLRVPTLDLTYGTWRPPASANGSLLGLLVCDGMAFRTVTARGFSTGDLLGAGDVIPARPPPPIPGGGHAEVAWRVVAPLTVAVLDARFGAWTARWPGLTRELLERDAAHTERLMARPSLVHRQRVGDRLLVVLRKLADRWGVVTPDGVLVPVALRHHQLAALVASLRSSVTLALRRLSQRGLVERATRGYLLREHAEVGSARSPRRHRSTTSPRRSPRPTRATAPSSTSAAASTTARSRRAPSSRSR